MVTNQITAPMTVYIHKETTNQSFIDMHFYLKAIGVKNNDFFLVLYDPGLAGVDPRDPMLSLDMKRRVLLECTRNFWYFIREVVRVPQTGGSAGSGARFKLDRGNLAFFFLSILNYNIFYTAPRQHGKTTSICIRILWCYNFGSTNSEIMLMHKDHSGSKANLADIVALRDALPSYLQLSSNIGMDGKRLKVPNTKVTIANPFNGNRIITYPSARSRDAADKLGRGATIALQSWDEFAFTPYNEIAYLAAVPAQSKAAEHARAHGAPHGIIITTTPGDLTTREGQYAYTIRNNATKWVEQFFDFNLEQMEKVRASNTNSSFFLIEYSYLQLGSDETYFKEIVIQMEKNWPKIRREVLLEWADVADNCAFNKEDLERVKEFCRPPIRTLLYGQFNQYQVNVYEDIDLRYPPIIGVDVSGAMYRDASAMTIIDSRTTRVCATLNCNYIPTDDLADVIYNIVKYKMPMAVVNCERNGGFGASVIQRLVKTSIKKNLYFEIKDRPVEEQFNGVRMETRKRLVKVYGTDSTKDVRARLIEILYDRVQYHKDKFISETILNEMKTMVVKKNGKVEHADGAHDDQVFSYLMALYVIYEGKNLAENFGVMRNTIRTDEDIEVEENTIDKENGFERIDIEIVDEESDILKDQLEFINGSKSQSMNEFESKQEIIEQASFNQLLAADPAARAAYEKKYHMTPTANNSQSMGYVSLPDTLFLEEPGDDYYFEDYGGEFEMSDPNYAARNGNLYDIFSKL